MNSFTQLFRVQSRCARNVVQPVPAKMRLEMLVEMLIEILEGGEILVNCKFKWAHCGEALKLLRAIRVGPNA